MDLKILLEELNIMAEPQTEYKASKPQLCLCCGEEIKGRSDKKYCNAYCRSQYHYQQNKQSVPSIHRFISDQLNLNIKLLKRYNKAGKATIREEVLLKEGFNPRVFTHYWKSNKGSIYFFVFEFGFMVKEEHGKRKYVLIQWQDYMKI